MFGLFLPASKDQEANSSNTVLHTTLRQKWWGCFAQIMNSSNAYASSLCFFCNLNTHEVDNHDDCHVLWGICSTCVDTKLRSIKATCIINGDRGQPRISSLSQCEQQKLWWRQENKAFYLRVCKHSWRQSEIKRHVQLSTQWFPGTTQGSGFQGL